ncbi:hypothetical protein ACT6QE_00635, partial [Staphylococcus aureus]
LCLTLLGFEKAVFNRVLCPSYQGFRIYRETLSRFSCAASSNFCEFNNLITTVYFKQDIY